jgi:hypothetical protein
LDASAALRSKGLRPNMAARLIPPNPMPFRTRNSRREEAEKAPGCIKGELSAPKEQLSVELGSIREWEGWGRELVF